MFHVATANGAKVMCVDVLSHPSSLSAAGLLIESEVNAPVYTRVVDVFREVAKRRVLERHARNSSVRQRKRVVSTGKERLRDTACRMACRGVR